jgi:hypothetical protein
VNVTLVRDISDQRVNREGGKREEGVRESTLDRLYWLEHVLFHDDEIMLTEIL